MDGQIRAQLGDEGFEVRSLIRFQRDTQDAVIAIGGRHHRTLGKPGLHRIERDAHAKDLQKAVASAFNEEKTIFVLACQVAGTQHTAPGIAAPEVSAAFSIAERNVLASVDQFTHLASGFDALACVVLQPKLTAGDDAPDAASLGLEGLGWKIGDAGRGHTW